MYDFDVVFIGSGHACWHAALALLQAGKKVAIAEEDTIAGTCTNWGCNAKILLDSPIAMVDGLKRYQGIGIHSVPEIDWEQLMAYKKKVITPVHQVLEGMFAKGGIRILKGHGKLVDEHTVSVGEETVTADYIVLGTGETPNIQDIPGREFIHDSKDFLDMNEFPKRIAIIGAGIIAMEFASIAATMHSEVKLIHHNDRVLRKYPKKYVDRVVSKMEKEGVDFLFNRSATSVERNGDAFVLTLDDGSKVETDYVLEATGRTPNVEGLGLKELGIGYSAKGIQVNEFLQTAVPNIYASGDCVDKKVPRLTPTATFESNYIAGHILGLNKAPIQYPVIPNLVFTLPRIAQCGVSVDEAEKKPDQYRVVTVPFGQTLLFMAKNEADCEFTFVFDKATDDFVGAAIYGSDADVLIDVVALIMNKQMTATELNQMIFAFPTQSYGLISLLMQHLKK